MVPTARIYSIQFGWTSWKWDANANLYSSSDKQSNNIIISDWGCCWFVLRPHFVHLMIGFGPRSAIKTSSSITTTTISTVLCPLFRTFHVSWRPQLRTVKGFWSSFTACMLLLMAASTFGLGRTRRWCPVSERLAKQLSKKKFPFRSD